MGALGRVELPTFGLGNVGQGLHPSRIKHLLGGFRCHIREKSSHSAVNCQRICQRNQQGWGGSLPPPSPRTSFPRLCVPDAAPHPGAAASADSAHKTNCSDTPGDSPAGILPRPTAASDDDVVVVADGWYSNPVATAVAPLRPARTGSQTAWLPVPLRLSPSGNGQPIPAATARSRYSWTVPSPIPQLRAIWRCPNPNSNLNRRTSLTFRMDFLLAGTLSSFIDGVLMPVDCPALLHLLLFVCGKHSAPSRTPFR